MKMINCYLKAIKFANYFVPIIPSKHRSPCLLAVGRETINVKLTACSCHVTYAFQSESTLYSLAKWLSVHLRTKWFWVRVQLQLLKVNLLLQINSWVSAPAGRSQEAQCSMETLRKNKLRKVLTVKMLYWNFSEILKIST